MTIKVNNIELKLNFLSKILTKLGGAMQGFTDEIKGIVELLTSDINLTANVPSALADPLVSFVESTPGNEYVDGKIQLIEVIDVAQSTSAFVNKSL